MVLQKLVFVVVVGLHAKSESKGKAKARFFDKQIYPWSTTGETPSRQNDIVDGMNRLSNADS
jgi:hypothetical protein